jgi:cyclase
MTQRVDRRQLLQALLGGSAAATLATLPAWARAGEPQAPLAAVPLDEQLTLFTGAGANVVALRSSDGLALVDGGLKERSDELLRLAAKQLGGGRIHTLFNTHWHPQQTGSNERLGREGATIIAHENTRLWLSYANPVPLQTGTYGPLPAAARPNKTFFYNQEQVTLGDQPVEYGYLLQAHTDGDMYVFFRKSNVLVTGGVVSNAGWPIIDWHTGGWIGGMVDGLRKLASLANDSTRIVPANGPVLARADLVAQQQMYATISQRLQRMLRQGLGPEEAVAKAPTAEYDARWGDPRSFVAEAFKSLWGHFAPDA